MILCPICKDKLTTKISNSAFYVCKKCETAIRKEEDMPHKQNNIYNDQWVLGEEQKRFNTKVAYYRLCQINRLHQINGIERILDLGCGIGILVDLLAKNGYVVDGVDSSEANIDYARRYKKGNYLLQDIESFDTGKKYDLMIASHLIEHLRAPDKFFKKVKTSMQKSGILYIATPNFSARAAKSLWRENLGGICGTDHRILYSSKSLSKLLSMHDFKIIYCSTKTRFNRMLEEIIKEIYFKKFKAYVRQEVNHANKINSGYSTSITEIRSERSYLIRALKKLYNFIKDSVIIDLLFFIPNKISEIKNRGEELIIIARYD